MSRMSLTDYGAQVRRLAERHLRKNKPDRLAGLCTACSLALAVSLQSDGIEAEFVHGRYGCKYLGCPHSWVEAEGSIIDVTATQFHWRRAKVFICQTGHQKYIAFKRYPNLEGVFFQLSAMNRSLFLEMAGVRHRVDELFGSALWIEAQERIGNPEEVRR